MWLGRSFATFDAFHATLDGFDRATNALLDEVRGKVGIVAQLVVQGAFGFRLCGYVVSIVTAMPAPLACGIGTMSELLDCLSKRGFAVFGSVELDDGGTTVFYCDSH